MEKEKTNVPQSGGKGRKPKADPAVFRYSVSFNATDHARFWLSLNSPVCGRKRILSQKESLAVHSK